MLTRVLNRLLRRRKPDWRRDGEATLFNYALHLAQEWGPYWLQPIQDRLGRAFPEFSDDELDRLNNLAQDAMKYGYNLAYELTEASGGEDVQREWRSRYSAKFPWVDKKNLATLYSTGRHYAWKDGVR